MEGERGGGGGGGGGVLAVLGMAGLGKVSWKQGHVGREDAEGGISGGRKWIGR